MSNTLIQIKRSSNTALAPAGSLLAGQPGYSYLSDRLFIGNATGQAVLTVGGKYYVQNPISYGGITGTAIAVEQQVVGSHKYVYKQDWSTLWLKMPYFQQVRPIDIFRDGNKDGVIDRGAKQFGLFGINLHRGGLGGLIDKWSAGCQVTPDVHWKEIIKYFSEGEIINFNLIN